MTGQVIGRRWELGRFAICTIAMALAVGVLVVDAAAETKRERLAAGKQLVATALESEAQGHTKEREALLREALEKAPELEAAHWHAGQVKLKKEWVSVDQVPQLCQQDARFAVYHEIRDRYENTVDGQLELANWCAKRRLQDQERAHLTAVLEIEPDHREARSRLGFQRVDGVWLSREETQRSGRRGRDAVRELAKWRPRIERIRQGLTHRSLARQEAAMQQLLEIKDAAAIPAMELVLGNVSEALGVKLVEALADINTTDSTIALARQAVLSPWNRVRDDARLSLKARPADAYVPVLLSTMYTPIQSRAELYKGTKGRLMYRHVFFREGQDAEQLAVLDTAYQRLARPDGDAGETLGRALEDANQRFQTREQLVARQNEITQELNERVCQVLCSTTGEYQSNEPEAWWDWWNDYNEVYSTGPKGVQTRFREQVIVVEDAGGGSTGPGGGGSGGGGGSPPMDCLAKGTMVWTATGMVAIERVQVGDLVLSQHPETGELTYKPVLRTTRRPPSKLVKMMIGKESIMTSGGHLFWVSGSGWVKSRQLADGAVLHGVSGTAEVSYLEDGDFAETYNLVVADFHTYFVGEARVMSHDNTIRDATDALVPGLEK